MGKNGEKLRKTPSEGRFRPNRKQKYGGNRKFELAAIGFLLAPHYIMGSISTPSGSLVLQIYHYAHANGIQSWRKNAKCENFYPFSNTLRNSFQAILKRMASTFRLVKVENYKGVWTWNFCRNYGASQRFCTIFEVKSTKYRIRYIRFRAYT